MLSVGQENITALKELVQDLYNTQFIWKMTVTVYLHEKKEKEKNPLTQKSESNALG